MRIQFERSGGIAGMRLRASVDTSSLPADEARALDELAAAARFFDLPAATASPAPGADRFVYRLTIEAEGRRHTVEVGEAAVPAELQPLLQRLTALARSGRGS